MAKGTILHQIIRNFRGYQSTVGKQGNQQPLLLGVRINIEKIFTDENFTAGKQQP